jgi:hypothetical protein
MAFQFFSLVLFNLFSFTEISEYQKIYLGFTYPVMGNNNGTDGESTQKYVMKNWVSQDLLCLTTLLQSTSIPFRFLRLWDDDLSAL